jgi:hypothetical protein
MNRNPRFNAILQLYTTMPGAPTPSMEGGYYLWGEVEDTEHWQFCAAIIAAIDMATRKKD